jgi:hypothetical protein
MRQQDVAATQRQASMEGCGKKKRNIPHSVKSLIEAMYLHETGFLLQLYAGKHDTTASHINLAHSPCNSADSL